jgi:hypothetical protein
LVGNAIIGIDVYARIDQLLIPVQISRLMGMLEMIYVTWYCHLPYPPHLL